MEKDIELFKKKFYTIRDMGYVKAINNYNSGIGLTFEFLLGKKIDNYPLPDFNNTIEIKTKLAFSKRPIHLFRLTPDGNSFTEIKRIVEKYGYYFNNNKVFNGNISVNKMVRIGSFYHTLFVDYKEEKIKMFVYDKNNKIIDNTIFWSFTNLENALNRKLKYLAFVQVWSTQKDGNKYYKYFRYDIYKLTNFYTFLNLINNGNISITFSIDTFINKERINQIHDHGTTFDIDKKNLNELFIKLS